MTNWRDATWDKHTPASHAQKLALEMDQRGVYLDGDSRSPSVRYADIVQAFADAADDVISDHVRHQSEKAEYMNAHEGTSESPTDSPETPHSIPAQSMIIRFMNGAEEIIHTHHPMIQQHGWTFRELNGIPYLVLGHGVNRRQYPLINIRFIELSEELL